MLRRLRAAGRPVHALSNFAAENSRWRESVSAFFTNSTPASSRPRGVAKPDPRIYEILFARSRTAAGGLLSVDNSLANVRAAEALGMAAIHFREGVDLEAELRARGAVPD